MYTANVTLHLNLILLCAALGFWAVSGNTELGNKDEEDTENGEGDGPGMLADGRSHPRSQLDMGLRKPVLPLKTLLTLKTQFKEMGFEVENFDEETGLILIREIYPNNGSNMSIQPTPVTEKTWETNSFKMNTTKLPVATNATLKTAPASNVQKDSTKCPTFRTMVNGTKNVWKGLKGAHGVKEGFAVVVNATQLTLESIVDCVSLIVTNIGEWMKGGTGNATATVSLPPAVTTPQKSEKAVANKLKGVGPSHSVVLHHKGRKRKK